MSEGKQQPALDRRDEFALWMLEQGLPGDAVMHYAGKASPDGYIWGEPKPEPEFFGLPANPEGIFELMEAEWQYVMRAWQYYNIYPKGR
jgi:hypothetical protein